MAAEYAVKSDFKTFFPLTLHGKACQKSNSGKLDPTRPANLPKKHYPTRLAVNSGREVLRNKHIRLNKRLTANKVHHDKDK